MLPLKNGILVFGLPKHLSQQSGFKTALENQQVISSPSKTVSFAWIQGTFFTRSPLSGDGFESKLNHKLSEADEEKSLSAFANLPRVDAHSPPAHKQQNLQSELLEQARFSSVPQKTRYKVKTREANLMQRVQENPLGDRIQLILEQSMAWLR